MLITVYQRTRTGWRQITQFYWWRVDTVEQIKQKEISGEIQTTRNHFYTCCPGCGRRMARQKILFNHACRGTLTDNPIRNRRARAVPVSSPVECP